jgi:hypothetical protein
MMLVGYQAASTLEKSTTHSTRSIMLTVPIYDILYNSLIHVLLND